uniref:Uncharacterized protein n=1 Tax=Glossina palpalis gambiensis TaxID=67801 RepID=A0A1B0AU48_9MUSC
MLSKYVKLEAHNDDDVVRMLLRKAYETGANRPFAIFIYNMPDIKQLADRRVDSNQDILEVFHKYYVDKGTLVPCPDYHLENSSGVGLNVVPLELSSGSAYLSFNNYKLGVYCLRYKRTANIAATHFMIVVKIQFLYCACERSQKFVESKGYSAKKSF